MRQGALLRKLQEYGVTAIGIDPAAPNTSDEGADPGVEMHQASAEMLPFPDGTFDAALFVNSLHHVPVQRMDTALSEAGRVVLPSGKIIIMEPLAVGTFFDALRPIEDETVVRGAAQAAIARARSSGHFEEGHRYDFVRRDTFKSIEPFLRRVFGADESRRAAVMQNRQEVQAAFLAAASIDAGGDYLLEQPIRANVLIKP